MTGPVGFDEDERGGVTVLLDGHPQSYVALTDPELLAFEYVEHLGSLLDILPAGMLRVTHVGGGGLTLARYVATTRPGSPQVVLEPDTALTAAVRARLPLPRGHRIRVRPADGRAGMTALGARSADVVVLDAYAKGQVPPELGTVEFLGDVERVLAPGGVLLANLADGPGAPYVVRVLAGCAAVGLTPRAVIGTHEVLKGRRFGNLVVLACSEPVDLDAVRRRVARSPFPTGVWDEADLVRRARTARPFVDADAQPSPPPPSTWLRAPSRGALQPRGTERRRRTVR